MTVATLMLRVTDSVCVHTHFVWYIERISIVTDHICIVVYAIRGVCVHVCAVNYLGDQIVNIPGDQSEHFSFIFFSTSFPCTKSSQIQRNSVSSHYGVVWSVFCLDS